MSKPVEIAEFAPFERQVSVLGRHSWSVPRLAMLAKHLEVMEVPMRHLSVPDMMGKMTLREMAMHIRAVNAADLNYPIILDEDGEVMDGRHRILKALVNGHETIKAVRFDTNPEPGLPGADEP